MYSRQINPPPPSLIKNGKPVFGTFSGHVSKLDIRGLHGPFGGVPLPSIVTNFRIKSSISFVFSFGPFIISIIFFDAKLFGFAEINIWNEETGRKYIYKAIMGPRRRFIPHNMEQGFCASFNRHRYVRISWDRRRDRISLIFNLKGDSARPSVQAAFTGHYSDPSTVETTHCVPLKTWRRCSASCQSSVKFYGSLTFEKTSKSMAQTYSEKEGQGLFVVTRSYLGYITYSQTIYASGIYKEHNISFVLENFCSDFQECEVADRNALFVDGKFTPLPPVKMTQPFGISKKWIIQDTENMVDLTFEPVSNNFREMSAFITKIRFNIIYGKFEGVFKTKDGEDIRIAGFGGIARDQMLRI